MKRFLYATAVICLAGSFYVQASTGAISSTKSINSFIQTNDKMKITSDELPQPVKDVLAGDFKEWTIGDVYLVKGTSEYYQIGLTKGAQKQTVNLDKDGQPVKVNM